MKRRPRLLSSLITLQFDVPKHCHLITFPNDWKVKKVVKQVKAGFTFCDLALWYQEVKTLYLLFRQRL